MPVSQFAKLDLNNQLKPEVLQLIHYFARDTTDKILEHIDRLDVVDTGALRDSIKSTVYMNAGGNSALVSFYYINYAPYVEMAVGKYYGVDADLKRGVGVKKDNIEIPEIPGVGYEPLTASFHNLPYRTMGKKSMSHQEHDALRVKTHRPRPFIHAEIKRQVERISYRLMEQCLNTVEIHMMETISDALMPNTPNNVWYNEGFSKKTLDYGRYFSQKYAED